MAPSAVSLAVAAAAASLAPAAVEALAGAGRSHSAETLATVEMHMFRSDCGVLRARRTRTKIPGAGMDPDSLQPYDKVLKDGYFQADCIKDTMFTHGDKFHDNKHEYSIGTNVSIVHYTSLVAKEDREEMTHEVCFEFCRTIPDMGFFGLTNGRECYCTPYFEAMASDSSDCDAVCPGNPTTMCGGKTKSSIFAMHMCDSTQEDLANTKQKLADADGEMTALQANVKTASTSMQDASEQWQAAFGKAGDPVAADLFQTAKVFAGELAETSSQAEKLAAASATLVTDADSQASADFSTSEAVKKGEALISDIEESLAKTLAITEELEKGYSEIKPELTDVDGAASKYYSVMYFVDKEYVSVPSTCGGTASEKPMVGTLDECARACDADVHECVGFSYFPGKGAPICFLFSKVKTATYYTKCGEEPPRFLQMRQTSTEAPSAERVQCMVKYSEFDGTTLKPDPSGKCKGCLTDLKKADRCFE